VRATPAAGALPRIELMQSTEVTQPFHRDGWVYEEKYDGWRMVAYKDGTAVRLISRAGKEHSRRFPELEGVAENDHTLIFPARRLAANGLEAWAQVVERGYEGYVAKDESSTYLGGRTLSWLKVKQKEYRVAERGSSPQ
jgi:ATP-dependent DNA ligase